MPDAALASLPAADLERRRTQLLSRLSDPTLSAAERAEATRQATDLAEAIKTRNAHAQRQALLGVRGGVAHTTSGAAGARTYTSPRESHMLSTAARAFIDSEQLRAFRAGGLNGQASFDLESRALLDTTGSQTGKVRPLDGPIRQTADRPTRILDLIDRQT